jgi:hypothetical protein
VGGGVRHSCCDCVPFLSEEVQHLTRLARALETRLWVTHKQHAPDSDIAPEPGQLERLRREVEEERLSAETWRRLVEYLQTQLHEVRGRLTAEVARRAG